MSIDLEWSKLDSSLSTYLVEVLNKQLTNADRPSFIGPIEVTSLDFGSNAPDVELVDLRDIYRDFLEDEDDADNAFLSGDPVKVTEGPDDDDGFEWVSRRAAGREDTAPAPYGRHLPQHLQYGFRGGLGGPSSPISMDPWSYGAGVGDLGGRASQQHWDTGPMFRSPTPSTPYPASSIHRQPSSGTTHSLNPVTSEEILRPFQSVLGGVPVGSPEQQDMPPQQQIPHPNLQLHFQINWQSNLRITITTSLLINYPSPMFMSLPIKLSVTGIVFSGEIAVAYEGERRRVHLCILDDLDPYGPAGDRPKRDPSSSDSSPLSNIPGIPPELDEDAPSRPQKALPIGQRLLPSIVIESEIGQTDKHVLKNVTRIERFIQDVIRKTVEEELVFPNFHTLVMGEQ
ncbi:hypothetical protein D9611_013386 [Ephemerocybe angulata]|uniref:Mitochondrial distribution and morphology protein 12 n=1 Tax=Ephemerocybe angulata TaxID=980116 RepID=A0A8H5CBM4_9AGAR|nr:hypothetical protein D9611_013386 [Tulosesus angulatus]